MAHHGWLARVIDFDLIYLLECFQTQGRGPLVRKAGRQETQRSFGAIEMVVCGSQKVVVCGLGEGRVQDQCLWSQGQKEAFSSRDAC